MLLHSLSHLSLALDGVVCEHMFVNNPNHKGNVAELAIATEAARLGLSVLKPLTEHERYDLVLGIGGRLLRVQCKWGRKKGDVISVQPQYESTRARWVCARELLVS